MSEEMKLSDEQIDRFDATGARPDGMALSDVLGILCAQAKLANAPAHADEPVAKGWLYTTPELIPRSRISMDSCYSHGPQRPDERAGWIPLYAHPSAGIRSEWIEECAKIALTVLRRPLEQHTLPADITSVRKAWGYAYAMGGNHMSEDIHKAIRALGGVVMSIEYCGKHNQRFDTDFEDSCPRCEAIRFDMTNAPTLPEEPEWYAAMRRAGSPHIEYIDTLRDQLEEAQRESERIRGLALKDPIVRLHNLCDALADERGASPYSEEAWEQADADNKQLRIKLAEQTARADANEKDARRYRFLRDDEYSETLLYQLIKEGIHKDKVDAAIDAALAKS